MICRWLPLLLAVLCAAPTFRGLPAACQTVPDAYSEDDCSLVTAAAYAVIPDLFYDGQADSLLTLLEEWEALCGPREVIQRTLILGAIWDGGFTEDLYDAEIMDHLRQRGAELAEESETLPARAAYDSFTVDLADQLLPHQPPGTPEAFFCLFYAGRAGEAWAMIESGELAYTDLAYYRGRRLSLLRITDTRLQVGVSIGSWYPSGDLDFVGDKPLVGVTVGWWEELWFGRLVGEWRPGRSDRPYWLVKDDSIFLSDRWDAALLGGEVGRRVYGAGPWRLDVFAGLGIDLIKPRGGSNDLLAALHGSLGAGVRFLPEEDSSWFTGFDVRAETIGDRNAEAVNLGGSAWSVRLVVGRVLATPDQETARFLGR
ncbi:MAG: hypothetical protein GY838_03085 [bacterium]|nr:hypothetical protein [bacterium]